MSQLPPRPPAPPRQPTRTPPSLRPPTDPVLQQRSWAAVMLALIGLFGMAMMGADIRRGVVVIAVGVVIAAIAFWLAVTAMSRARRIGTGRPRGAIFATVMSVIGVVFGGMVLISFAVFWPQLTQYSQCLSAAGTHSSQQACGQQLQNSVGGEVNLLGR